MGYTNSILRYILLTLIFVIVLLFSIAKSLLPPVFAPTPTNTPTAISTNTSTSTPKPTTTPTEAPTPTATSTGTPTNTSTPTATPTPTPTLCLPTVTPLPTPPEHQPPHPRIVSVKLKVGDKEMIFEQQEKFIEVPPGDTLEIVEVIYSAESDAPAGNLVAGEAYVRKAGWCPDDFDDEDGRFAFGVPIKAGNHTLTPFINARGGDDAWTVAPGWNRLVIVLVHYFPSSTDDHIVDARFFVNLRVKDE